MDAVARRRRADRIGEQGPDRGVERRRPDLRQTFQPARGGPPGVLRGPPSSRREGRRSRGHGWSGTGAARHRSDRAPGPRADPHRQLPLIDRPRPHLEPGQADRAGQRRLLLQPQMGTSGRPNSNTLYAVWYGTPDPRATRPTADREIYMRISYDSGKNWTDRIVVNDDAALPNVQHYDPNISVAPNGRLDVTWFDGRNSPTPEIDKPSGNDG